MFEIKIKKLFNDTLSSLKKSMKRFPLTICVSTTLVIMLIIMNEMRPNLDSNTKDMLGRINMVLGLGIPLSLCIKLIYEKLGDIDIIKRTAGYVVGGILLFLYYKFFINNYEMVSMVRYIGVSVFLYLAFIYIPKLGRDNNYEYYVIDTLSSFSLTVVYSAVLYFGLSAILFTIDQLFSIHIEGELYYYIFLFVAGVFALSMFLAKLPYDNYDYSETEYPKSLRILMLYIVVPLILAYISILYAYFIKIVVTMNWPSGLISHLVLWFSAVCVGVIFLIYPMIDKDKIVQVFIRWFPKGILPILIMMFISIGLRIRQYGFTENRYFVLVLGLWVFGIFIYFCFNKKFRNIIIPISLSIIVLNSVFGPLSSFSISRFSQNNRLKKVLVSNNMLKSDKTITPNAQISEDDKAEISMILKYFNRNYNLQDVKYVPDGFKMNDMDEVFGFSFKGNNINSTRKFISYNTYENNEPLDIKGYDYLVDINKSKEKIEINENIEISYNPNTFAFVIKEDEDIIYNKKINIYAQELIRDKNLDTTKRHRNLTYEEMTFEDKNERIGIAFVFKNVSATSYNTSEEMNINHIDFYILLEMKQPKVKLK